MKVLVISAIRQIKYLVDVLWTQSHCHNRSWGGGGESRRQEKKKQGSVGGAEWPGRIRKDETERIGGDERRHSRMILHLVAIFSHLCNISSYVHKYRPTYYQSWFFCMLFCMYVYNLRFYSSIQDKIYYVQYYSKFLELVQSFYIRRCDIANQPQTVIGQPSAGPEPIAELAGHVTAAGLCWAGKQLYLVTGQLIWCPAYDTSWNQYILPPEGAVNGL